MSDRERPGHYGTAPADRVPFPHKLAYGVGSLVNNLLAAAIGGMTIVLNLAWGMNPALVGLVGALPRLADALTDPIMGYVSDNTRSRWGRRRPYIFVGALAAGLLYAVLWRLPADRSESFYFWYFLAGSVLFYVAYTVYATPWVALGYELTPDYHERTRLMGVQNFIGQLVYLVSPWFLWIMTYEGFFRDQKQGAAGLALVVALLVMVLGIIPALVLREPLQGALPPRASGAGEHLRGHVADLLDGMKITFSSRPFLKLCAATFLVFNGFMLVSSFQYYVIIYYVFAGDQTLGAQFAGYAGTVQSVATFGVIALVAWLGTRIGKRHAFFVSTGVSIVGYALKWFCYDPESPLLVILPAPFIAFGIGGLFTLMGSMMADVVDVDELETHQRREGMYGSIFWWVVKLGLAAALAAGGFLLNATGFDVTLGGRQSESTITLMRLFDIVVPMVASAIAIWAVVAYPITEASAHRVREELERRRAARALA